MLFWLRKQWIPAFAGMTAPVDTQYLRPATPADTSITCTAWLVERTRNALHIHAEARNAAGKIAVLCQSVNQILPAPAER